MGNTLSDIKYYKKQNGIVVNITKEEHEEFTKQLKKEGKKYICPNCSICDCEKIKYTNINVAEEVDLATYVKRIYESNEEDIVRKTRDIDFIVYECKRFKKFKDKELFDERHYAKEVIRIYKEMLELKSQMDTYKYRETANKLLLLSYQKRDLYNSIKDENIKKELDEKLQKIKEEHIKTVTKNLKLTIEK